MDSHWTTSCASEWSQNNINKDAGEMESFIDGRFQVSTLAVKEAAVPIGLYRITVCTTIARPKFSQLLIVANPNEFRCTW